MKILITGAAGFIGFHLANRLLGRGDEVVGLDSINNYYDVSLKIGRLEEAGIPRQRIAYRELTQSRRHPAYQFIQLDLVDENNLLRLFAQQRFDRVVHLAAQAGVRYSLKNPKAYIESNVLGFTYLLESCRAYPVEHLVYGSSSSVYGLNEKVPYSVHDNVDHPVSLYAATKKSNELMAHTYSHLFGIPTTGLRFFTVYGPWGRPDMAPHLFTKAILEDEPIQVFNHGRMRRDFTYVDDIVEGVVRVLDAPPAGNPDWDGRRPDPAASRAPYRLYNIGNSRPVELMDFIRAIEAALGREARKEFLPLQPGDVEATWADVGDLARDLGYRPDTPLEEGVRRFVTWYLDFYTSETESDRRQRSHTP